MIQRVGYVTGMLIVGLCAVAGAATLEVSPPVKEMANTVMKEIYQKVLEVKPQHKELVEFGKEQLSKNQFGFYTITYAYSGGAGRIKAPYAFGLGAAPLDGELFSDKETGFQVEFPLLNVKFVGYLERHPIVDQFNVFPLIEQAGLTLAVHQQEQLPLRLSLEAEKEMFEVGQPVEFTVKLKNVSLQPMMVKTLGYKTLYFLIGGEPWATYPLARGSDRDARGDVRGGQAKILRPGESYQIVFQGDSFYEPRDIVIQGFYSLLVDGVNPMDILKLRIMPRK